MLSSSSNCFYASHFYALPGDSKMVITHNDAFYFTDSRYTEAATKQCIGCKIIDIREISKYLKGTFGFEEDNLTYREYSQIKNVALVPFSQKINALRSIKDEDEVVLMKKAQELADKAFLETLPEIKVGITEKQLAAKLEYNMKILGAERTSFDTIVASGPNSSMPHAVPTNRKIQDGDFVTIDFGCVLNGYCSDTTRTVAVGKITDEMQKVYDTVLKAHLEVISKAKPGMTGEEVDSIARKIIDDAGYGKYFGHSLGHGVGIDIHEAPIASPKIKGIIPEGAFVSDEPGIYIPEKFGVRIEDVLYYKDGKATSVTSLWKTATQN